MRLYTQKRGPKSADLLWPVEHQPVYTLGLASRPEHLLNTGSIPVLQSDRGGQVTFHGPGQLVIYTLIDLRRRGLTVKALVCRLEQAVIDFLGGLGLKKAHRVAGAPGIYLPWHQGQSSAKIAALGLKVSKGCAYHGIALNLDMNLAPFSGINPCGFEGLKTIDLATMGVSLGWDRASTGFCAAIEFQLTSAGP